ncbi:ABC transporter permease subunit [Halorarius halobius]|uniref:ABC transporter permease subunit n=1 Tax=Halorarius halobius TaxID=2962671 RepID=UPI0020CF10D6|nr:ABC transporter permease subunit [Halorarius halobius]
MTYRDVFRRDIRSVYRSRTGTAVAAIIALTTVVAVGLFTLASNVALLGAVGALLTVGALVALVFIGDPKQIAGVVVAFTALAIATALLLREPTAGYDPRPPMQVGVLAVGTALSFVVPLVALLGSYAAVVGERETGSVRFLLGLPNSRDDAYLGKFLARAAVVCVPLVAALALTGVVVQLTFQDGSMLGMLGLALVTVPYALLFVGIGLTASAYADSSNRAVAVVITVFAALRAGWPALQWLGLQGMREDYVYPKPEWFFWVGRVNPINAYVKLTTLFAEFEYGHPLLTNPDETISTVATTYPFAAAVLLAWTVVAPVFGLLYFRSRDLL